MSPNQHYLPACSHVRGSPSDQHALVFVFYRGNHQEVSISRWPKAMQLALGKAGVPPASDVNEWQPLHRDHMGQVLLSGTLAAVVQ